MNALINGLMDPMPRLPKGTVVVAAHPGDEVVGAGVSLAGTEDAAIWFLTDGVPADRALWPRAVAASGRTDEGYAALRREETLQSLFLAGIAPEQVRWSRVREHQLVHQLPGAARVLAEEWARTRPPMVVTHAYEGGHPDHDAAALAVHAALALLRARRAGRVPRLVEMTGYHDLFGQLRTGAFLPAREVGWIHWLGHDEASLKQRMLGCHVSQAEALAPFGVEAEGFRFAPHYPFSKPPHDGPLWFERRGWGRWESWRSAAAAGVRALQLDGELDGATANANASLTTNAAL